MVNILALLQCLEPHLETTTIRQMSRIILAMLAMTERVTMLGISRWAGKGGSYRTIQRWYSTVIPWMVVHWWFFYAHVYKPDDHYLLAGDESVVTKSGKKTYGLDRFFSGLYGKPVAGLSFFSLSLISTQDRRSYPIMAEQIVRTPAEKAAAKAKAQRKQATKKAKDKVKAKAKKRKPGRPEGSKNKDKTQVEFTPELLLIKTMIDKLLSLINGIIPISYLVMDGHFGNNNTTQLARQCGLHLISKLRVDSALHFPYSGHDRRRKYGDKINYGLIPAEYLKQITVEDDVLTCIYQATMRHKAFAEPLNVVIIVKVNLKTQARAHVVLFSSDLELSDDKIIDYYKLRFQIEFNFRDAKQFWGLEDFMNIKTTTVTNAANLSLFMVSLSSVLLQDFRQLNPQAGVLDLKAHFRGHKYVAETLKLLPKKPDPILLEQIFSTVARLGSIHTAKPGPLTS